MIRIVEGLALLWEVGILVTVVLVLRAEQSTRTEDDVLLHALLVGVVWPGLLPWREWLPSARLGAHRLVRS